MLTFEIPDGSRLAGIEVSELRMPRDAVVTLILREGALFVPSADTALRFGDHLLLAVTDSDPGRGGEASPRDQPGRPAGDLAR